MTDQQTPAQLGFRMPAEWEQHSVVWLAWPHDITTFTQGIDLAERTFCEIIKAIHASERVELLVLDEAMKTKAMDMLQNAGVDIAKVNFHIVLFQDVWTRDYGPFFLANREQKLLAWSKFQYNAYGKGDDPYFTPVLKDNDVFNLLTLPGTKFEPGIVLEGGAIEVNGQGTLVTTEQCLLNPNRNPGLGKEQIESYLKDYLGVNKVIWLKKGLTNDHTDGHIDDIAKFVAPNRILCAYEEDEHDENYAILQDNYQALTYATDQGGKPFEVIKLPMPHMWYEAGHTVHAGEASNQNSGREKAAVSYMNFYIGNKVVLVPTFQDPNDSKALDIIQFCFPDRTVVPIDCRNIIYGGGTIHCMTQQQPAI